MRRVMISALALIAALGITASAASAATTETGITATSVTIGATFPLSGPASSYGVIPVGFKAYISYINARRGPDGKRGVGGRQIVFKYYDDGYNPANSVQNARKLVEQDKVFAVVGALGTDVNVAIRPYLNANKVPHLFTASGDTTFGRDTKEWPWTIGYLPNYQFEGRTYGKKIAKNSPNAKIAVIYQNDDFGKDYLNGLHDELGSKAKSMIVAEVSFELSDPTVDSQIVTLKASGADTFFNIGTAKFAAQAIRKAYDIGWKPLQFVSIVGSSVGQVMVPAGPEKGVGIITMGFVKDPTDPQWDPDPAMRAWRAFMKKYYPDGDLTDWYNVYAYAVAQTLVQVFTQCADDLTRENVMKQAASLKNVELPLLLPGIRINTSPADYRVIRQVQLQRFDGKQWVRFGELIGN